MAAKDKSDAALEHKAHSPPPPPHVTKDGDEIKALKTAWADLNSWIKSGIQGLHLDQYRARVDELINRLK